MAYTYVYGPYHYMGSHLYQFRSFLAYEVKTNNDTKYELNIQVGIQLTNNNGEVGENDIVTAVSGTGQTSKSVTTNYRTSLSDSSQRQVTISTFTWSWTKGQSTKSITLNGAIAKSGYLEESKASVTLTVPKKTSYTIKYSANGGSGAPSSQTKWYGETLTLSSTKPTRTGYTFSKWNTEAGGGGTNYSAGGSYTSNSTNTLYAQWTANTYTVKYNANGGSGTMASSSHKYDTPKDLTANAFTRTGYGFNGWNTKSNGSGISYNNNASVENLTSTNGATVNLYAQWNINSYTLTANANGGSITSASGWTIASGNTKATKSLNYNAAYGSLPVVTRTGYDLIGWYTAASGGSKVSTTSTIGASNTTIYAQWKQATYKISYNINTDDPSATGTVASTTETINTTVHLSQGAGFTRNYYTLEKWRDEDNNYYELGGIFTHDIASDVILYAIWRPNKIIIEYYYDDDNNQIAKQEGEYTNSLTIKEINNDIQKTGYELLLFDNNKKWVDLDNPDDKFSPGATYDSYSINEDKILRLGLLWEPIQYVIICDYNDSSGRPSNRVSATYNNSEPLNFPVITSSTSGFYFNNWNTEPDGDGDTYTSLDTGIKLTTQKNAEVTLYAQWSADEKDIQVLDTETKATVSSNQVNLTIFYQYGKKISSGTIVDDYIEDYVGTITNTSNSEETMSISGSNLEQSQSITFVFSNFAIDEFLDYRIDLVFTTNLNNQSEYSYTVKGKDILIDVNINRDAIGFFDSAPDDNQGVFIQNYGLTVDGPVSFKNTLKIEGTTYTSRNIYIDNTASHSTLGLRRNGKTAFFMTAQSNGNLGLIDYRDYYSQQEGVADPKISRWLLYSPAGNHGRLFIGGSTFSSGGILVENGDIRTIDKYLSKAPQCIEFHKTGGTKATLTIPSGSSGVIFAASAKSSSNDAHLAMLYNSDSNGNIAKTEIYKGNTMTISTDTNKIELTGTGVATRYIVITFYGDLPTEL